MHQFRIEVYEYNEDATSANTITTLTRYADNHEDARMIYQEFREQRQENGNRKYQVKLAVLCYKYTAADTFFAQFQA